MAKNYIPTFGEEVGNAVSHGVMSVLALLAIPVSTLYSYILHDGSLTASVSATTLSSMRG